MLAIQITTHAGNVFQHWLIVKYTMHRKTGSPQQHRPRKSEAGETRCHWHGLFGGALQQGKPSTDYV